MNFSDLSRREKLVIALVLVAVLAVLGVVRIVLGVRLSATPSKPVSCVTGCPCGNTCISCDRICHQ